MNKTLKVMTSAALLAGVVAPVAVDTVSAQSKNSVDRVISVSDDYDFSGKVAPVLTLKEDSNFQTDFKAGDTFRLVLPSGVKWNNSVVSKILDLNSEISSVRVVSDQTLEVSLNSAAAANGTLQVETLTVAGTATTADSLAVTVKSDILPTQTVNVAVAANDTAAQVAVKVAAALNANGTIFAKYTAAAVGTAVTLTDNGAVGTARANDAGLEISYASGNGLTGATSVNTTAGARAIQATNFTANVNDSLDFPMDVKVDGASGELKVKVEARDSGLSSGEYTFAVAGSGKTTATVEEVKTIGKTGVAGTIRIDETNIGAVYGNQRVTLKLPTGYEWNYTNAGATSLASNLSFAGGYIGVNPASITNVNQNGRTLSFDVNLGTATNNRGTIYITPLVKVDGGAKGDIEVNVSGSAQGGTGNVSDADVVIAKYADWGASVKVAEVKEILAGKVDGTRTATITIEESITGSLLNGRDIDVVLPEWVKVTGINGLTTSGWSGAAPTVSTIDGSKSKLSFTVNSTSTGTSKGKIEFKVDLSVKGNEAGDIEAKLSGAGLEESSLVVAKAVAPVTAESVKAADVKIGLQNQDAPDFIIYETKKESFERTVDTFTWNNGAVTGTTTTGNNGQVTVTLPVGVSFAATPTVEVIDGNAEVENINRTNAGNGGTNNQLTFVVKSESSKPAKIKVSGVKLTVDRTVPEGKIEATIGGTAIVENNSTNPANGQFNQDSAAKFVIANTVTPAPGNAAAVETVFTLGSTTYTVGDEEKVMDVAPFSEGGRTFMPIRYVAESVGADSILWDQATSTATIMKGDRIVQLTNGSKTLKVNGASITMDAAAKVKDGRTVLPVRFVGQAMGAKVDYNETDKTVTVK